MCKVSITVASEYVRTFSPGVLSRRHVGSGSQGQFLPSNVCRVGLSDASAELFIEGICTCTCSGSQMEMTMFQSMQEQHGYTMAGSE